MDRSSVALVDDTVGALMRWVTKFTRQHADAIRSGLHLIAQA
jgi:hypothetical protein